MLGSLIDKVMHGARVATAVAALLTNFCVVIGGCASYSAGRDPADARTDAPTLARQVCAACHGPDGNPVSPNFPRLAGQRADYLSVQLTRFRDHERHEPAAAKYMWGWSHDLSDHKIQELARYFSIQMPALPAASTTTPASRGAEIYNHGLADAGVTPCAQCHGARGEGSALAPVLAGQFSDYCLKQLRIFREGSLRGDGAVMEGISRAMSDRDMSAVAVYLEHLDTRTDPQ